MDAGAWDGGRTRTPAMNEAADFKNNRTIHKASIHAGFKSSSFTVQQIA